MQVQTTSFSSCEFFGSLGQDATIRHTKDGKPIASISLAVTSTRIDENGEPVSSRTFIRASVFGEKAKFFEANGKKGTPVYLRGRIKLNSWTANGVTNRALEFIVEDCAQDYVGATAPKDTTLPKRAKAAA